MVSCKLPLEPPPQPSVESDRVSLPNVKVSRKFAVREGCIEAVEKDARNGKQVGLGRRADNRSKTRLSVGRHGGVSGWGALSAFLLYVCSHTPQLTEHRSPAPVRLYMLLLQPQILTRADSDFRMSGSFRDLYTM
jgi:hypothetical protein